VTRWKSAVIAGGWLLAVLGFMVLPNTMITLLWFGGLAAYSVALYRMMRSL
jgi:hypothetical protein